MLVARLKFSEQGGKTVDFFLEIPSENRQIYAFSKKYKKAAYEMCKLGIGVNELLTTKKKDKGIMLLVKHTKYMLPYLMKEYQILAA